LNACPGTETVTSGSFEFIPKRSLGVVSGNDILSSIDFTGFSQTVIGWTKERKLLQSGEVVFVQGLTKGISYKMQVFPITFDVSSDVGYYDMRVDMSVGYYKNFKYITINVSTNGDYDNGVTIENALNTKLTALSININADVDVSDFSFTGTTLGYEFDITNLNVTLDGSAKILTVDVSQGILAAKYPNTAMLGYVLKVTYPDDATTESDRYIDLKHVPTTLTYYEASTGDPNNYVPYTKTVDAGNNYSSATIISAGDYLNYVDTNNLWEKVGQLRIWLATQDPATNSSTTNLIPGFYLYNPQSWDVYVEYMILQ